MKRCITAHPSRLLLTCCIALSSALSSAARAQEGPGKLPSPQSPQILPLTAPAETARTVVVGRVVDADGRPVERAVVVSSAGGLARSDRDGGFELALALTADVEALQVTAVGGSHGANRLVASARIDIPQAQRDRADTGDLELAASTCMPSWLPTFGAAPGIAFVRALTTFDDGSGPVLVVGGEFVHGNGDVQGVVTWDGSSWSALGSGVGSVGFTGEVDALLVFDDGSGTALYAGGTFTSASGTPANHIARWNGSSWSALGSGLSGPVHALAAFDDGSGPALYVGGDFGLAGGVLANNVARWNGSSWSALGSGQFGVVRALAAFGGELYAGGDIFGIARWNGASWSALGSGVTPNATVFALATYAGGGAALYVGGEFTTAGGAPAPGIARWNGTAWSSPYSGSFMPVRSFTVFDDGSGPRLYCGFGEWGFPFSQVMRWDGASWTSLGTFLNGWTQALASYDDGGGAKLYAGGNIVGMANPVQLGVVRWESSSWKPLDDGLDSWTMTAAVHDDGSGPALYAAGLFFAPGGAYTDYGPAKWDGASWTSLTNGSYEQTPFIWWPTCLVSHDDGSGPALFVGGGFSMLGGTNASRVARWNGSSWTALGSGLGEAPEDFAIYDDGSGAALYAAGYFTTAGGAPANRIARWDGSSWSALGSGLDNSVWDMTVFDDGSGTDLIVGGPFTSAGGASANRIARWDGASWGTFGSGFDNSVSALAVFDDGSGPALYAGGRFTSAGGTPANRMARWNGSSWSPLGSGLNDEPHVLATFDDGSGPALYAGGKFTTAGGLAARYIARWNGSSWSALEAGLSGAVNELVVHDDGGGPALFVGGAFTASPAGDSYLAKWGCSSSAGVGVPFCFGSNAQCPCGNGGVPDSGCNNSQGTGGVQLSASGSTSLNTVVLHGSGFPPTAAPGVIVIRSPNVEPSPVPFGDGLRCVGLAGLVRMGATSASGGTSAHPLNHLVGAGTFRYQLWYRNTPQSFCNPSATFNTSSGLVITWP